MNNLSLVNGPMQVFPRIGFLVLLSAICLAAMAPADTAEAQEATSKQKTEIKKIKASIDRAGKQYAAKKYETSAKYAADAQEKLEALLEGASPELLQLLKPEHARLSKAHEMLTKQGQTLTDLSAFPAIMIDGQQLVSFQTDVAPIVVAKCGRCHVSRAQGGFSAENYQKFLGSGVIADGLPDDSRFIEVIVDGDMPRGGLTVEEKELEVLKTWIAQGAKFDGDDPTKTLTEITGTATPGRRGQMSIARPKGNETVSFGLHVAPILVQNCSGCHIDNNNPRGNLNMTNFQGLMRGGDAGAPITPGKSGESLIYKRILAGEMPPNGKLDDADIQLIGKWIDEGASFDGDSATLNVKTVAAKSKADSQTHEELVADRAALVDRNWKLIMPGLKGEKVVTKNFFVMGSMPEDRLAEVGESAEKLAAKIQSTLKSDKDKPFVKGNSSLFVFAQRYDFSEFGKMVEKKDFPKEIRGYWGFSTIDSYVGVIFTRADDVEDITVPLTAQLAALHVGSMASDVPRWFADGLGYWTAEKLHPRDEGIKSWSSQANEIAANMQRPDDFLTGKMPEHQSALVSYAFVKKLRTTSGFKKLMKLMGEGNTFEASFGEAFGQTPAQMFGSADNRKRKR